VKELAKEQKVLRRFLQYRGGSQGGEGREYHGDVWEVVHPKDRGSGKRSLRLGAKKGARGDHALNDMELLFQ